MFEKDLSRLRNSTRSHGAYFGVSVAGSDAGFLWLEIVNAFSLEAGILRGVTSTLVRCFFGVPSSPGGDCGVLPDSFVESDVVDLFPKLFNSVLNFLFVAFMVSTVDVCKSVREVE